MNTFKNIGFIVCGKLKETFLLTPASNSKGYNLKKVLIDDHAAETFIRKNYPTAEIVKDKYAVIQDKTLDLIVITSPVNTCTELIAEALKSGIPVRIVSQV